MREAVRNDAENVPAGIYLVHLDEGMSPRGMGGTLKDWGYEAMNADRKIIIVAGPNGAGKTTFAKEYLPREGGCPVFINADMIAAGLSPFQPDIAQVRAGRLMLEEIDRHAWRQERFAFETTLSGRGYVRRIRQWRTDGYTVRLVFLSLATPEEALERVALRVRQGGHDIPSDVIRRRFARSLENFKGVYRPIVNFWQWFDNSGDAPALIDQGETL